jgi:hypothetical protein
MEQQRLLPTLSIEGTIFIVDVQKEELTQKDHPQNCISFNEMLYSKDGYRFDYDKELKNKPDFFIDNPVRVHVPHMTELDVTGMAEKYHLNEAEIIGKTDLDLMVDPEQLALREHGQLPVIEISGHPFYVDLFMDMLRPKDDFASNGIRFAEIDDYYVEEVKHYRIPYNPATHSFEDLDYENIKAIPKGIIVIDIPLTAQLDPVAYARINGFEKEQILRGNPIQLQMKAPEVPWDETPIKQIIARNLKKDLEKDQTQSKPQRKRGRGI